MRPRGRTWSLPYRCTSRGCASGATTARSANLSGSRSERGYNQAFELAKPFARALGVPIARDGLARIRATPAQTGLDATARRRNLRGAFAVSHTGSLPKHVALFDDVVTTGATVRECARVLRRAGVERIDVWALARAPQRRA